MSTCKSLRDTIHHLSDLATRRLMLLADVADALDGPLSTPDGVETILRLREKIRQELGQ